MLEELGERGVLPVSAAGKRGAILNVWRNASSVAVQQKPLAVLDTRTVAPDDLGLYYLVEGGDGIARRRMGQNLALRYSPQHAWFYYPLSAPICGSNSGLAPDTYSCVRARGGQ